MVSLGMLAGLDVVEIRNAQKLHSKVCRFRHWLLTYSLQFEGTLPLLVSNRVTPHSWGQTAKSRPVEQVYASIAGLNPNNHI